MEGNKHYIRLCPLVLYSLRYIALQAKEKGRKQKYRPRDLRKTMRVTYVARSFLDYRVPVFEALSEKLNNQFYVVYSADYIPDRVHMRARQALGDHAIGMIGEKRVGPNDFSDFANTAYRVVYQPGVIKEINLAASKSGLTLYKYFRLGGNSNVDVFYYGRFFPVYVYIVPWKI